MMLVLNVYLFIEFYHEISGGALWLAVLNVYLLIEFYHEVSGGALWLAVLNVYLFIEFYHEVSGSALWPVVDARLPLWTPVRTAGKKAEWCHCSQPLTTRSQVIRMMTLQPTSDYTLCQVTRMTSCQVIRMTSSQPTSDYIYPMSGDQNDIITANLGLYIPYVRWSEWRHHSQPRTIYTLCQVIKNVSRFGLAVRR